MEQETLLAEMNRLREELRQAQVDGLIDYKAMANAIGKNPTYVQQFVTKGSPRIMHAHLVEAVRAKLLEARQAGPSRARHGEQRVSGPAAFALLERLDIIPHGDGERAYNLLKTVWNKAVEKPLQ